MDEARLRRSRAFAVAAFLALGTALLLPWWVVSYDAGGPVVREAFHAFRPDEPYTTAWGPSLTGVLASAALLLLFVRVAAGSHRHEPDAWRRDVGIALVLALAAVLSAWLWPQDVPSFWGGRTLMDPGDSAAGPTTETALPGIGWWVAAAGVGFLGAAAWLARPGRPLQDPSR